MSTQKSKREEKKCPNMGYLQKPPVMGFPYRDNIVDISRARIGT
jgi:hypothetical protein